MIKSKLTRKELDRRKFQMKLVVIAIGLALFVGSWYTPDPFDFILGYGAGFVVGVVVLAGSLIDEAADE
jgi:hypothetical protein